MSQQINLFNPVFRVQKKHFSAAAMLQVIGVMLGALLILLSFAARQNTGLERLLASSERDSTQMRERLVDLGKQFSDQGTSKQLEQDLAKVQEQLRRRTELLGEMHTSVGGNVQGFSPYLAALARQTTQGVWLTGLEITGQSTDLVIHGRALNADLVPIYVRALSRDPLFAGRALSSLQVTAREEQTRRFLEFTLNIPLASGRAS